MPDGSSSSNLRIFLNYRRSDTADATDRLYDALAARFGDDHVFMDIDAIDPGLDFRKVITEAVDSCDVCLAVIGRQWLSAVDSAGRRRLDRPDDFVRMELQAALERDVRVVPVLVQDVDDMPSADELPDGLKDLAWRNAHKMRRESWSHDLGRLVEALERVAAAKAAPGVAELEVVESPVEEPATPAPSHHRTTPPPRAEPVVAADPAPPSAHRGLRGLPRSGRLAAALAAVVVAVVVIVVLASIGGSAQPADVVSAGVSALAAGDYTSVCGAMTPAARATAVSGGLGPTCPRALEAAFATRLGTVVRGLAGQASVGEARQRRDRAIVVVRGPYRGGEVAFTLPLLRLRGRWMIDETYSGAFDRNPGTFTRLGPP